eukprot:6172596-Pyramimonas_sp.AAC.1
MLLCDVLHGELLDDSWRSRKGPFVSVLRKSCALDLTPEGNISIVDAEGIFDTLGKRRLEVQMTEELR